MPKINNRVVLLMIIMAIVLSSGVCFAATKTKDTFSKHNVQGKLNSSQITYPFNPSDIFVFTLPDFNDLEIPTKTHAAVIGSTHQSNDGGLTNVVWDSGHLAETVKIIHDAGWKYATTFSSDIGDFFDSPSHEDWASLDIYGNKIIFSMPLEKPRVWNSFHNSEFKDCMIRLGKLGVDSGVDIICIDSWSFNLGTLIRNVDFSPNSVQGFREYLRGIYTSKQLKALGVSNIDTFDYGAYIKKNYLAKYKNYDFNSIPLYQDFVDFQVVTCKEFWGDFIKEVRAYADTKGQQIFFTSNAAENDISIGQHNFIGLSALDEVDGFISEYDFVTHPFNKMMPEYKLLRGLGKPAALIPNCGNSAELFSRPDLPELMKVYIAEAYSSGEFTYVPYANMINSSDGWQYYSADMNNLYSYFDFINNNKTYYDDLISAAKTAVLYSYPSIRMGKNTINSFFGTSNLLLDANRQYDVVYAGDNQWVDDKLTLEELNHYDLLILPNVTNMSDKQLDIVLSYLNQGGSILAYGCIGSSNEMNSLQNRPKLTALLKEGTHKYGKGTFQYTKEDLGTTYLSNKDSKVRQKAIDLIDKQCKENITISNASNVVTTGYLNEKGSQIIHLINYNYDVKAQSFSQQKNLNIKVTLNKELLGKELVVRFSTPDEDGVKELKYSKSDGAISFKLPNLKVYGVIIIGDKNGNITPTPEPTPVPTLKPTPAPEPTPIVIHGENLVQNPGFEAGTLSPWEFSGPCAIATNANNGTYSVQISSLNTGIWQNVTVKPNTTYTVAAWIKNTESGDEIIFGVKNYGGSEKSRIITSTFYSQVVITFTTGPSNTEATICVFKNHGTAASYADDISVTDGS